MEGWKALDEYFRVVVISASGSLCRVNACLWVEYRAPVTGLIFSLSILIFEFFKVFFLIFNFLKLDEIFYALISSRHKP
jgi:hypothetical protein